MTIFAVKHPNPRKPKIIIKPQKIKRKIKYFVKVHIIHNILLRLYRFNNNTIKYEEDDWQNNYN